MLMPIIYYYSLSRFMCKHWFSNFEIHWLWMALSWKLCTTPFCKENVSFHIDWCCLLIYFLPADVTHTTGCEGRRNLRPFASFVFCPVDLRETCPDHRPSASLYKSTHGQLYNENFIAFVNFPSYITTYTGHSGQQVNILNYNSNK